MELLKADTAPTIGMFILAGIWSLIISSSIGSFLEGLLGIRSEDQSYFSREEKNLFTMIDNTMFWVTGTTTILATAAFAVLPSFLFGLLIATILAPMLWYFATSKVYPKINGIDFGPRFAEAMAGRFAQTRRR